MNRNSQPHVFAVLGDIHGHWKLALGALICLQRERDIQIDQLFCVGDLGLFLAEEDWAYLTGPRKYKHPESSSLIRAVWKVWDLPTATIGGNHEPWHRLRVFDTDYFGNKLTYTNAGLLAHSLENLRVVGLSGIRGLDASFNDTSSWMERVTAVRAGLLARKTLTYYTQSDLELVLRSGPAHLVLTHDWPVAPSHKTVTSLASEPRIVLENLSPAWHFCGHHHRTHQ